MIGPAFVWRSLATSAGSLHWVQRGVVEGIFVSATARVEPAPVESASAVAGRGLRGDRYFAAEGTFSEQAGTGRDLTLIEAEALEALEREVGIRLPPPSLVETS